jgi:CPA1 family monovalent cation:H+ antiporter
LILLVLTAIVVVAAVAKRFSLPYPIAFVVGGSLLAFAPNVPTLQIDPNWVFLIFLPPLLYASAWQTDWNDFKTNARAIGLLAIGLVVFTTALVAVVAHALVPGLGWAAAFALGAIVSPPDAVAAGAVFERFSVPRRIVAILEGEGLVNDATALVIYRFAVAAVLTGTFSVKSAGFALVFVAAGGVVLGFVAGYVVVEGTVALRRLALSDYLIDNAIQLLAPYAIYLAGESMHVSGVLAVVTAGIFVARQAGRIYQPDGRLVAFAVWDLLIFLLNGLVFLLIGLELRSVVSNPGFAQREIWIGLTISLLVIVLRIAWVYPATFVPRMFSAGIRAREPKPPLAGVFVVAWSGMRGIVSLASALALPLVTRGGAPFPARGTIVFITFCVIFVTLVFQGLSLIPLLRFLKIGGDGLERREIEVRVAALRAGIARLHELEPGFTSTVEWEVEGRLLGEYEYRISHLAGHLDGSPESVGAALDHELQEAALAAERREITRLRDSGEIPDEIFRRVQYDLDLASERIS